MAVSEGCSMSKWKPVTNGVPQGSVLGAILLSIFNSDMGSGIERTLSESADDTKLRGALRLLEGRDAIQMDLESLEEQARVNLLRFYKAKCKLKAPSVHEPLLAASHNPKFQNGFGKRLRQLGRLPGPAA
ncbi:uncharacterized protein VSU04_001006 [Chlamydotis macqueenii]